jgi:hypothetical protein
VVERTHLDLNTKFDMSVVFTVNYSFSEGDVLIDSESLLVIDLVNLKIKPAQSFGCAHRSKMCSYVYKYMRLYCI